MSEFADRLERIQQQLYEATPAGGVPPRLIAVSKTWPLERLQQAYACGIRTLGESRVQELALKAPAMPEDVEWHCIGHLQKNKVRDAIRYAAVIHSVDSVSLLHRINTLAASAGVQPTVLLQANLSGEESKYGFDSESIRQACEQLSQCPGVCCMGLMTMTPREASNLERRALFAATRELRNKLQTEFSLTLPELSMGMTSDYLEATQEGATMVRIGTALFGNRT